jgi:carboxylesterase
MANHSKCCVPATDIFRAGGRLGFLLVHRHGGTPAELAYVADELAAAGHTVACPLLYGHGGSRALLGATTWLQWYASVEEAHADLRSRCDVVIAGGLSSGALLALHLAAQRPAQVQGTVLFAPTIWPNGWAVPWYGGMLRLLGHKRIANFFRLDERAPYGIKDELLRRSVLDGMHSDGRSDDDIFGRSGGAMLELKWLAGAVMDEVARVRQPCLIFHPRHDDRSSLSSSLKLQRRLGGRVDMIVLEDSYHLVTLDRERAFVVGRALEFASAVRARALDDAHASPPGGGAPLH